MKSFFFRQTAGPPSQPPRPGASNTAGTNPSQRPRLGPPPPPPPPPRPLRLPNLSDFSTPAVRNSAWSSRDFMLGAGMVIFQPSTKRIVVVYETERKYWFLPRGRKDIGESLEQTALREAYEESGYRASFMPLLNPTHQPLPPDRMRDGVEWDGLNTEPLYTTITSWHPRIRNGRRELYGGEYLTTWYAGQIPDEAIPERGTGMPDEQNYESHLLSIKDTMERLEGPEQLVVDYAWGLFIQTENHLKRSRNSTHPSSNNIRSASV